MSRAWFEIVKLLFIIPWRVLNEWAENLPEQLDEFARKLEERYR